MFTGEIVHVKLSPVSAHRASARHWCNRVARVGRFLLSHEAIPGASSGGQRDDGDGSLGNLKEGDLGMLTCLPNPGTHSKLISLEV